MCKRSMSITSNQNQVETDGNRHGQPSVNYKLISILMVLFFVIASERLIDGYYFNINIMENLFNHNDPLRSFSNHSNMSVIKLVKPNLGMHTYISLTCSPLLPLMGGLLGDGLLGRFKCTVIGVSFQSAATIFFTAALFLPNGSSRQAMWYISICLLFFCFGILKANIQAMGDRFVKKSGLLQQSTYFVVITTIQIIAPRSLKLTLIKETKYKMVIHCAFFVISTLCLVFLYLTKNNYAIIQEESRRVYKIIQSIVCSFCPQQLPLSQKNVALSNSYHVDAQKFIKILPPLTVFIVFTVNVYFCEIFLTTRPPSDLFKITASLVNMLIYIVLTKIFDESLHVMNRIQLGISFSTIGFIGAAIAVILKSPIDSLNTLIFIILTFGQLIIHSSGKEIVCAYLPKNMEAIAIGFYETAFGFCKAILFGILMYKSSLTVLHDFIIILSMTILILVCLIYSKIKQRDINNAIDM